MISRTFQQLFMLMCATFVALPIFVVCASALNGGRTMLFPPENPTLDRFIEFFVTQPVWREALWNSTIIALGTASLTVVLAWPVAYWLWTTNSRFAKLIAGLSAVPFALPPIVFGVGLSFLWGFVGLLGNMGAAVASHSALYVAMPIVMLTTGLQDIDKSHIDAASTMGASRQLILTSVIVPQMLPYTISSFFFVLVVSFNEFIVMALVSASAFTTVTMQIFSSLRNGFTPTMAVAAIVFIMLSVMVFSLVARFGNLPRLMGADQAVE
jgi:putative spermidine/putrescine transport system permease protein